jgi:predicted Zn finger-like uncharacterized protein
MAVLAAADGDRHIARTMRIICPACAAAYEVPDRLIGTGRSLRCRSCGHAWRVDPEAGKAESPPAGTAAPPSPVPPSPAPPLPDPGPLPDQPPFAVPPGLPGQRRAPQLIDPPLPRPEAMPRPTGLALRLAWAASLFVVLAGVAALWLFRTEIAEAWPPAARLYLLFGMTAIG